ncbi:MAG: hypothetical protein ACPGUD_12025 [Parashewanella sp.]
MPNQLIVLIISYAVIAIAALLNQIAIIATLLLLLLCFAIVGKQKSALIMLRAFTVLQGISLSLIPFALNQSGESLSQLLQLPSELSFPSSYDIWIIVCLSIYCLIQLWISFIPSTAKWFTVKNNMNLMQ